MIKQNLHTHNTFCDGTSTAEEMVISAIEKGYDSLGFSGHIKTVFPSIAINDKAKYFAEITRLKEKYADKIKIYIGGEFDLYSDDNVKDYEYTIGSVHFDLIDGNIVYYDHVYEIVKDRFDNLFSKDGVAFFKKYFDSVKRLPDTFDFDIVGHLDVVTKHNLHHNLFDENDPVYIDCALDALHHLVKKGKKLFEINYGGIKRGYKSSPYPSEFLLKEMIKLGCEFVVTSDAHNVSHLITDFTEIYSSLKELGIDHVMYFDGKKFLPQKI